MESGDGEKQGQLHQEDKTVLRICDDTNEGFATYAQYLKTNHWARVKAGYTTRHPRICQMCGATQYIALHHIVYDHIGHEQDRDMVWLCRTCHKALHAVPGKNERISVGRFILDVNKERRKHRKQRVPHVKRTPMQPKPPVTHDKLPPPTWYYSSS